MTLLKKQGTIHGVTPMYYLFLPESKRSKFNEVLSYTDIELTRPFMDAVIEIYEVIEKYYINKEYDTLPEKERSILLNPVVFNVLLNLYKNGFNYNAIQLKELRNDLTLAYDIDHDIKLGRLSFNELLKLNNKVIDENLSNELNYLGVTEDPLTGEYVDLDEAISRYELFRDNIIIAIELLQKRIERIESKSTISRDERIKSAFKEVCEGIEDLDSMFLGEQYGVRNEDVYRKMTLLRNYLRELGLDTTIQKYSSVHNNMNYVSGLTKKKYNQKVVPQYETKKRIFDKYRVDVVSRIETLKKNYQVDIFHF